MNVQGKLIKPKSNLRYSWLALVLALISPIALYLSLQTALYGLSVVFFICILFSVAITVWKGKLRILCSLGLYIHC